jgi:phage tail sheath protein FI
MPSSDLLLAAKIVVREEPPAFRNLPPVATAIAAMAGVTERGPLTPQFVTSFEEWVGIYGGYIADSDLALAVEGSFRNGLTALWTQRITHHTDILDPLTSTAVAGSFNLVDRGGVAGPAILDSASGPFDLAPGEDLVVDVDNTGAATLTFSAGSAVATSVNTSPFALVNGDTLVYRVKLPGSTSLGELQTITFDDSDALIAAIGTATAQELVNVINRDGIGISAVEVAGAVQVRSDKKGTGAQLIIDASSTAITAGKLDMASGTTNGTGNVADINSVTATEIAGLLTGLPLGAGTATVVGDKVRLTSTATGLASGEIEITAATTALGIFAGALPIIQAGTDAAESDTLQVTAKDPGEFIENYSISIEAATSGDSDRFNLRLKKGAATIESWPNLSMDENDDRYAEDFVSANSSYLDLVDLNSPATPPNNMPKIGEFSTWAGQDNGLAGLTDADFIGSDAGQTGLYAFDQVANVSILAVPGRATVGVHNAMLTYCEVHRTGSCFAVLDCPEGLDAQGVKAYFETTASLSGASEFGAFYWPRVKVVNPSPAVFGTTDDGNITVPPSGHIVGAYARLDAQIGGVHKAPAGISNGRLFGVVGFETDEVLDERKRDVVFPARINPITTFPGTAPHIDGARTLKGDGNFPTVGERRGVIFIAQTVKNGIIFAKHLPNNRKLREQVRRTIVAFLLIQFGNEAFRGNTASESFFVDVSDALNPPELEFAGQMKIRIGLATNKPMEFGIVIITQDTRAIEESLAQQAG